jgi:hypothetical protein
MGKKNGPGLKPSGPSPIPEEVHQAPKLGQGRAPAMIGFFSPLPYFF